MPRTTDTLVKKIIAVAAGVDLTPFIQSANNLASAACAASIAAKPGVYTDGGEGSAMELIERWLAAHFYTILDNQLKAASAGTVQVTYDTKIGFGLKNSMYGQQAMLLDVDGNLAKLDNANQTQRYVAVGIRVLGTTSRRRIDEAKGVARPWWFPF